MEHNRSEMNENILKKLFLVTDIHLYINPKTGFLRFLLFSKLIIFDPSKPSRSSGPCTRWHKIQPKCYDIIRRELWCYICMVLLVAWDSEHDTTTPRYRLIFTCQHTHPYYSCLIPLPPISNELLWKQKQINKKPMVHVFLLLSQ